MNDDERIAVTREPETVVIQRAASATGWWVAALVAIVAIFGVLFMINRTDPTTDDLQAARDQGAVEANMANATMGAQQAAVSAANAAQDAATGAARATESAAQAAAARTAQAVDDTADAARDVSATVPDPRD